MVCDREGSSLDKYHSLKIEQKKKKMERAVEKPVDAMQAQEPGLDSTELM